MSNSKLVNYTKISPSSSGRDQKIDKITIHHMAGDLTVEQCGELFYRPSTQASANYGIGSDGRVGMYVEEANRSWCSSSPSNDHRAVTIEVANDGRAPDWHVSDKALAKLIELCVDICKRNGIKQLNYTGDKTGNLTRHNMFAATTCPGPYLQGKFPYIAVEVNKRLGVAETPKKTSTTKGGYTMNMRILRKGCEGKDVRALQILLKGYGYNCGNADGIFGSKTEEMVVKYQKDHDLTPDGEAGPATMGCLLGT